MIEEYSINENMSDLDLIFHSVSKENVVRQNIDTTNLILENLRKNTTKSKKKLMITFDGYDNDKREVYEIDEIRKYVKKVFEKNHDLFYYLTSLVNNDSIILACLGNLTNIALRMIFYLSGIFYNINERLHGAVRFILLRANPIAFCMNELRKVMLQNSLPSFLGLGVWLVISILLCVLGVHLIHKNENSYAKVI